MTDGNLKQNSGSTRKKQMIQIITDHSMYHLLHLARAMVLAMPE
jgi:hypothetical protein